MRNIAEGLQYGHVGWTYNRTDRSLIIGLTGNGNKKKIYSPVQKRFCYSDGANRDC